MRSRNYESITKAVWRLRADAAAATRRADALEKKAQKEPTRILPVAVKKPRVPVKDGDRKGRLIRHQGRWVSDVWFHNYVFLPGMKVTIP